MNKRRRYKAKRRRRVMGLYRYIKRCEARILALSPKAPWIGDITFHPDAFSLTWPMPKRWADQQ